MVGSIGRLSRPSVCLKQHRQTTCLMTGARCGRVPGHDRASRAELVNADGVTHTHGAELLLRYYVDVITFTGSYGWSALPINGFCRKNNDIRDV